MNITARDKNILRELAKRQADIASQPEMKALKDEWYLHNDLKGTRPMFTVESWSFPDELPLEESRCETKDAKAIEKYFLITYANYKYIKDDKVVPNIYPVSLNKWFKPFDIDIKLMNTDGLGHQFVHIIEDLDKDFGMLKKSGFGSESIEEVNKRIDFLNEIFGDVLTPQFIGDSQFASITQNIVHIMGMENMFFAMYDYPEKFHKMMDLLTDNYLEFFDWLEEKKLLTANNSYGWVGNGTVAFTHDLSSAPTITTKDSWIYMDSQETVGISNKMFGEFIFPYYRKVSERFGLLSYGCCEPVHGIFDDYLCKLGNLRKLSISAWCDEKMIGERLKGTKTIYFRKPSPNFLGVGEALNEKGLEEHIKFTLRCAEGCKLEFSQRDVYTINHDVNKLKKYVDIVKGTILNF